MKALEMKALRKWEMGMNMIIMSSPGFLRNLKRRGSSPTNPIEHRF